MNTTEFKKLTRKEQRVAIAKDVLAQISNSCMIPQNSIYISPETQGTKQTCTVCAIGSVMKSAFDFSTDKPGTAKDYHNVAETIHMANYGSSDESLSAINKLTEYFDLDQLMLMEAAFEDFAYRKHNDTGQHTYSHGFGSIRKSHLPKLRKKTLMDAKRFGRQLGKDAEVRLRAIMQNIIANDGEFKP